METLLKSIFFSLVVFTFCIIRFCSSDSSEDILSSPTNQRFQIEGRVTVQHVQDPDWITNARVLVDGGQFLGILKSDGYFAVMNVPSGSYMVEVTHPDYAFDPVRVEINSKGKIRAVVLNNVQPSLKQALTYPLKFKAKGRMPYFQQREQWRVTDFLFSPMVMMMFFPLILMFVLPKLMNSQDPETQREMQQSMNMLSPKQTMPDISEMLTKWLSGGTPAAKKPAKIKSATGSKKQ